MRPSFIKIKSNPGTRIPYRIRPYNVIVTFTLGVLLQLDNLSEGLKLRECGDPSWFSNYPTSNKCFKIMDKEMTKEEGLKACLKETEYLYYDPLLTILSPQEQLNIVYEIFDDRQLHKHLWLGGFREGPKDWKWDDNSSIQYSHWTDKSHKQNDSEKCFRMSSDDHAEHDPYDWWSLGKWEAVSCSSKNLVICQKPKASVPYSLQHKINEDFQKESNKMKKQLDQARKHLRKLESAYQKTKEQLDQAKQELKIYRTKLEEVETESRYINKSVSDIKEDNLAFLKNLDTVKKQTENLARDLTNKANSSSVEMVLINITNIQEQLVKDVTAVQNLTDRLISNSSDLQGNLTDLRRNLVPIGFVYIQYPGQQDPREIWPNTSWVEESSKYAGDFFRVVGGNSSSFGIRQLDATRQLSRIKFSTEKNSVVTPEIDVPTTGWSKRVTSSRFILSPNDINIDYLQFETPDVEVRPVNMAVRIFVRVS